MSLTPQTAAHIELYFKTVVLSHPALKTCLLGVSMIDRGYDLIPSADLCILIEFN